MRVAKAFLLHVATRNGVKVCRTICFVCPSYSSANIILSIGFSNMFASKIG